jgi:CRP-like cAMP-binding protein
MLIPERDDRQVADALDYMRRFFAETVAMDDAEWQLGLPYFNVFQAPPKTCLQPQGEDVEAHYFVVKGLVRFYYNTEDGREVNKAFYADNHIVGNLSSIILSEPSRYCIETLEHCLLVRLPLKVWQQRLNTDSAWNRLFDRSCQLMLVRNERREAELMISSAGERFRRFVKNFPDYLDRIPQYHIASYLGITPVALSRCKADWLREK